jgi:hypothetical protein
MDTRTPHTPRAGAVAAYGDAELERDAALFLSMSVADFDMWSRDLRFMASDEDLVLAINDRYTSPLRALSTLQCVVRAEQSIYAHAHTSAPASSTRGTEIGAGVEAEACAHAQAVGLDGFVASLPHTALLSSRGQGAPKTVSSKADSSFKQLKRDVERDCFVFNGTYMSGSLLGIDAIINSMTDQLDFFVRECGVPCFSKQQSKLICEKILRTACRTNSGGTTFQTLQEALAASALIIPDSRRASPLHIVISIGDSNSNISVSSLSQDVTSWGVVCKVACLTVFSLSPQSDSPDMDSMDDLVEEQPRVCIEGVYENILFFDLQEQRTDTNKLVSLSECVKFENIGLS